MNLRPYQEQAVVGTFEGFGEFQRQLGVAPTGAGKTIMFAAMAARMQPERTLVLAHREELIEQAVAKIHSATGIVAEVEKAERRASLQAPVVVASVQSMQGDRLRRWPYDHFGLVVVDEAHHAIADSYQSTLSRFDEHARVIGVTATPSRSGKKQLGAYFENIAFEIGLLDLIRQGYLCPITVKCVPLQIDLTEVKQTSGDFDAAQSAQALEPILESAAKAIAHHARDRKTVVFLPLCSTSERFAELLCKAGIDAKHVAGESVDRKERLAWFDSAPAGSAICNAMLLTEGWDCPSVDCVAVLRPTKSQPMFAQCVGRGTRLSPDTGKRDLLLLDFLWLHQKHNLVRPAHLIATSEEQARAMTEISTRGRAQSLMDLQDEAEHVREAALARELAAQTRKKSKVLGIEELATMIHDMSIVDYEPTMKWHGQPATEKQLEALAKFGIDRNAVRDKGQASMLLDRLFSRTKQNLATPKQLMWLMRFKIPHAERMTRQEAAAILDRRFGGKRAA